VCVCVFHRAYSTAQPICHISLGLQPFLVQGGPTATKLMRTGLQLYFSFRTGLQPMLYFRAGLQPVFCFRAGLPLFFYFRPGLHPIVYSRPGLQPFLFQAGPTVQPNSYFRPGLQPIFYFRAGLQPICSGPAYNQMCCLPSPTPLNPSPKFQLRRVGSPWVENQRALARCMTD